MENFKQLLEHKIEQKSREYYIESQKSGCGDNGLDFGVISGASLCAELLVTCYDAIQRRMTSDDACGHSFDENLGEVMNKLEEFVRGR